jgi:hypothetical protein
MTRLRQKEEVYVYLQIEGQVALFRQFKKTIFNFEWLYQQIARQIVHAILKRVQDFIPPSACGRAGINFSTSADQAGYARIPVMKMG